nr:zinc finger BED domain-containing protein RICESLEEPER 2-like [Ipomoea batatas]
MSPAVRQPASPAATVSPRLQPLLPAVGSVLPPSSFPASTCGLRWYLTTWYVMDPSQGQSSPVDLTNDNDDEIMQPSQLETQVKKDVSLQREYTIGSHQYGTSILSRHLSSCKQKPKYEDVGNMLIDHEGKLRAKKIDHNRMFCTYFELVQDGLKVIGDSFYKVRESVRWNSAYKMLDTAIKYRRTFSSLQLLDTNYKHCPSHEEWVRVEKICDFLMPFNEITKLFSGSTYLTSNLYFRQVWKIEYLLTMNMKSGDSVIKDMACGMKIQFDKYSEQYSVILVITYQEKLDVVKNKLYKLFEAYKATSLTATTSSTASTSQCENVVAMEASDDFDDEFLDYCVQDNMQNGKFALDVYLNEPQMDMKRLKTYDRLGRRAAGEPSQRVIDLGGRGSFFIASAKYGEWEGFLNPLHLWLRREIVKYVEFAASDFNCNHSADVASIVDGDFDRL